MNEDVLFAELYGSYAHEVRKYIFVSARRSADLTEEIFQNTWLNAYRYLGTLKDAGAAKQWLFSIARSEARRYFYSRNLKFFPEGVPIQTLSENEAYEPEDEAESRFPEVFADSEYLKSILSRMSDADQQLILLRYLYDMSLTDIAGQYGANYNTVKSSMRRALGRMRKIAAEDGMPLGEQASATDAMDANEAR